MKKEIAFASVILSVSASVFATDAHIIKNRSPGNIYGPLGVSYATFTTGSTDFPSGTLNKVKTLTSVHYTWYNYQNGTTEKVELCYDKPYYSGYQYCTDITANQSDSSTAFNALQFDFGSTFYIRHTISGTESPKRPSLTPDQIIINYSYN